MTLASKKELAQLKRAGKLPIAHQGEPCLEEYLLQQAFAFIAGIESDNSHPGKLQRKARWINREILAWGEVVKER